MINIKSNELLLRYHSYDERLKERATAMKEVLYGRVYDLRTDFPLVVTEDFREGEDRFRVMLRIKDRDDWESGECDKRTRALIFVNCTDEEGNEETSLAMPVWFAPDKEGVAILRNGLQGNDYLQAYAADTVVCSGKKAYLPTESSVAVGERMKRRLFVFDVFQTPDIHGMERMSEKKAKALLNALMSAAENCSQRKYNGLTVIARHVLQALSGECPAYLRPEERETMTALLMKRLEECLDLCLERYPQMLRRYPDWKKRNPETPEERLEYAEEVRGLSYDLGVVREPMEGSNWRTVWMGDRCMFAFGNVIPKEIPVKNGRTK